MWIWIQLYPVFFYKFFQGSVVSGWLLVSWHFPARLEVIEQMSVDKEVQADGKLFVQKKKKKMYPVNTSNESSILKFMLYYAAVMASSRQKRIYGLIPIHY